jgi:RNA polymerase sigma-70 factor (ECF subfamily)
MEDLTHPPRSTPEELALLARLRAGDEAAFATLIERHHGALLRLARVFVSSRAIAEEVVQETWVGVVEGLASFEGRASLKTWIFRILTNRAKTRGVREGRSVSFSALGGLDSESEPAADPARFQSSGTWADPPRRWNDDNPERLMIRQEVLRLLEDAIESLPPNQRAVAVLRDVDGLDSVEVCNVLQISETNQRVLLHRARCKLRRVMEKYFNGAKASR